MRSKPLTPRERQILALFASGQVTRTKDVARELDLSVSTVRNHLCRVAQRLGTQSVTQAVVVALRDGLLHEELTDGRR
ncbi:MAG: ArsR family transcriptional regulator [Acidimicrobiia bacterium]|nr:ArsR family transcriptional regulator [Acidimicrobiia bacterium]